MCMATRPDDHDEVIVDRALAYLAIAFVVATIGVPLLLALFR